MERVLFVSRKALKGRFFCYFLRRAKSNQKARGTSSCDLGSKFRAVDFWIKLQALCLSRNFMKNCRFVPYSSEYFEPVRRGYFTA